MDQQVFKSKLLLGIGGIVVLLAIFLVTVVLQLKHSTQQSNETPVPTPFPLNTQQIHTPQITALPRQAEHPNAIDTGAPVVETSQTEIAKLYPFLPFNNETTLQNGISISIVIPGKELQDDPWKLTAQIFGIDYQVAPQDAEYKREKEAFLTGANIIFAWMRSHQVDPEKIIIKWGNQAYIQNRADEWLRL